MAHYFFPQLTLQHVPGTEILGWRKLTHKFLTSISQPTCTRFLTNLLSQTRLATSTGKDTDNLDMIIKKLNTFHERSDIGRTRTRIVGPAPGALCEATIKGSEGLLACTRNHPLLRQAGAVFFLSLHTLRKRCCRVLCSSKAHSCGVGALIRVRSAACLPPA